MLYFRLQLAPLQSSQEESSLNLLRLEILDEIPLNRVDKTDYKQLYEMQFRGGDGPAPAADE